MNIRQAALKAAHEQVRVLRSYLETGIYIDDGTGTGAHCAECRSGGAHLEDCGAGKALAEALEEYRVPIEIMLKPDTEVKP